MVIPGLVATTIMISPSFSLGSSLRFGLLMTKLSEYKPGAIFITPPGSAASIASWIVL